MKKQHITTLLLFSLIAFGCSAKKETATEEVPTTLEQHNSGAVTSSSSYNSSTGGASSSAASATGGTAKGSGPTSFAFSTNSMSATDTLSLTDIRDIAENRGLREYLQNEAVKLLLEDGLIDSEDEKISLSITNEWVMVNKKLISEPQAQRYVDLLKSKMSMGEVFNYSFNQY